jgi:hypothetical protein
MPHRPKNVLSSTAASRRRFLAQSAAAAAATLAVPAFVRGTNLNNKLNIAIIGAGGRGASNTGNVASENIVALCDVNAASLDKAAAKFPQASKYVDFRKLLDRSNQFDAVVVSTCEHTHAFATLPALQLGKHVYCEKPLTYNIAEARVIREAAAKAHVATQMGTQMHATENFRRVVEKIQAGAVGPVREVHVWVSRAWGWQPSEEEAKKNKDIVYTNERPRDASPVPAGLDWELWLGPAPYRPFNNVYFPGPKWYRWWDFGNGTMSDLGSHWNDMPFWALKLRAPLTVEASGPSPHPEIAPASMHASYEYPARGDMPAVRLNWYQGTSKPQLWRDGKIPDWKDGVLFIGDKGMLLANYAKNVLLPEKDFADYQLPSDAMRIPPSIGHHAEWIQACKTGCPTTCNFEYAGWLTEANHLGNVAYRAGRKLQWDPIAMRATNCPEADPFIRRQYREGWRLG